MSETNWALYALIAITFMAIGANMSEAGINADGRDLIMNAFGSQGYINNSWFSGDTRFVGNVNASGYRLSDVVVENGTFTGGIVIADNGAIVSAPGTNYNTRPATGQNIIYQNSTNGEQVVYGDGLGTQVAARWGGHTTVNTHNAWDLGASGTKWRAIYAVTNGIGDLQEDFTANPSYTYALGDVVAVDNSTGEIRPVLSYSDKVVGVVAVLPHTEQRSVNVDGVNTLQTVVINDHAISIYGKTQPAFYVKVKGTINKGDYLVYSGTPGVVSSLYNMATPIPGFNALLPATTDPYKYNFYAGLMPRNVLGTALESYNSASVGTIEVLIGR